jgi:hypothetical protein
MRLSVKARPYFKNNCVLANWRSEIRTSIALQPQL